MLIQIVCVAKVDIALRLDYSDHPLIELHEVDNLKILSDLHMAEQLGGVSLYFEHLAVVLI